MPASTSRAISGISVVFSEQFGNKYFAYKNIKQKSLFNTFYANKCTTHYVQREVKIETNIFPHDTW